VNQRAFSGAARCLWLPEGGPEACNDPSRPSPSPRSPSPEPILGSGPARGGPRGWLKSDLPCSGTPARTGFEASTLPGPYANSSTGSARDGVEGGGPWGRPSWRRMLRASWPIPGARDTRPYSTFPGTDPRLLRLRNSCDSVWVGSLPSSIAFQGVTGSNTNSVARGPLRMKKCQLLALSSGPGTTPGLVAARSLTYPCV